MMQTITPVLLMTAAVAGDAPDAVDFNRDVRPILSDNCYACHGPDANKRKAGLRLDTPEGAAEAIAGGANRSELVRRVFHDGDDVMPPAGSKRSLTAAQRDVLRRWVDQGAPWAKHWAYVAPEPSPPPEVRATEWPLNPIDGYVLGRLEPRGLGPSPEADRRTLMRRVSFDLLGLPPTPGQVNAFREDGSPDAWEKVIDRALSSPPFGERMAVYWLDLVRYADTVGYHGDQDVSVSPYRDYVIDAFNSGMAFDRFTREQLAGDLLPVPTRDQLIASGYNRLGMMSAEGGVQPKEYLAKYAADRVRTAGSVWLGSTTGCCECHDHKFDPFTQKDFYSLAAFFADIKEQGLYSGANDTGKWGTDIEVPSPELPRLLKPIDERIAAVRMELDTTTPEIAAAQRAWEGRMRTASASWQPLRPSTMTSKNGSTLSARDDASVVAGGTSPDQEIYTLTFPGPIPDIRGLRLEVLPDESLPQDGPGRAGNGNFVVTELTASWQHGDGPLTQIGLRNASATVEQQAAGGNHPDKKWSAASAIDGDKRGSEWGWAILPDAGKPNELVVETASDLSIPEGAELLLVIEQRHSNPRHTLGHFRVSVSSAERPLRADPTRTLPEDVRDALAADEPNKAHREQIAKYFRTIAPQLAEARQRFESLTKEREKIIRDNTRTSLITVSVEPRTMRVLPRGNWMDDSGAVVEPSPPGFLPGVNVEGRLTRVDLAEWITSEANPLTARTFANRMWAMSFGTGLSKVLDDLGAQGEAPSHPELLDHLAIEFREDWDVKDLLRSIVTSRTYRQSSMPRPDLKETDPTNRLLARQSRYRIPAEFVRDNALSISGLLVRQLGGRSVKPYQPAGLYRHLNFPAREYVADTGESQYRRGLYTHWQRQFLHPAMKAFDAPAREECTAQRPRSNTPLGALVLLNDPSYVEAARVFAERALTDGGDGDGERVEWLMRRALSRQPSDAERTVLLGVLQRQRAYYRGQPGEAKKLLAIGLGEADGSLDPAELAAWTAVCRTVLNMHELITRN